MDQTIKIGVSSCLLGKEVRYNGGHSHDRYVTGILGQYFTFVDVCPEVEAGFGIPRETLRLVGDPDAPRLLTTKTNKDFTEKMQKWAKRRVVELEKEDLCGFIFKKGSPSSGMERVRVYTDKGMPSNRGIGMFARAFMDHFPLVPTEEDGRLNDSILRENFIERIFALRRWRLMAAAKPKSLGNIVSFHTGHKLQVMSHSVKHYREMGRLVAHGKEQDIKSLYNQYEALYMQALSLKGTVKKNVNILQHMAGYFKKLLSKDEKRELQEVIDQYHNNITPLIVPITLFKHYIRKYDQEYLKTQYYLNPHPIELKLRNRA